MSSPEWIPKDATSDEERLLREHVVRGSDIERIKDVPGSLPHLIELKASERPTIGVHFVVWGSVSMNDIREWPVKRSAVSEDEYAAMMRKRTELLVVEGLKDPDPAEHLGVTGEPKHRADRAEKYARWRYKGFVCGEVASL